MNFLVDNQLPEALCRFLKEHGYQSVHVLSLNMDEASDAQVWSYAASGNWIVVSKDEEMANSRWQDGKWKSRSEVFLV